jgi:hypothetical protein
MVVMIRRLPTWGAALAVACTPALNWREVHLPPAGARATFPCKPSQEARRVKLADMQVEMTLHACSAAGATWALAQADVADVTQVGPALEALTAATGRNIGAARPTTAPLDVPGMTPNRHALRVHAAGSAPDGTSIHADAAVFAKGARVFQATVLAPRRDPQAVDTFFDSLRTP